MHDRQIEVAELAKRQPGIGMHFANLPTETEVAEFGIKARARLRLVLRRRACLTSARVLLAGPCAAGCLAAGVQRPQERQC